MSDLQFKWPEGEELVYLRPPKEEYHGALPNFYPPGMFHELDILKENWEAIRDEIMAYEKSRGEITGMDSYSPADTKGTWSTVNLVSYMIYFHKNRKKFPLITKLTDQIPSCTTVTISILHPHTEIKPHYGDTNGVIRAHLGLIVPDPYPIVAMQVGDEVQGWKEGELLFFTIVNRHMVWSKSDKKRYLLLLDFVPEPLRKKQVEICAKTLGSQTYIFLYKRIGLFKYLPEPLADFMCFSFSLLWRVLLPIQRAVKLSPI
jgi:aspartyl/asparaginyl beta-hydroxylase (cupin superfamily)